MDFEYFVVKGVYRRTDVWEVIKGASNNGTVLETYKTEEAAKKLVETLALLANQRAR